MTGKPGEQFEYGAYHLNTFAYALERKLGKETFEDYLKRRLLDPIGVKVGSRLFTLEGPSIVRRLVDEGARVFLDRAAADLLRDKILDVTIGVHGRVEFFPADAPQPAEPGR